MLTNLFSMFDVNLYLLNQFVISIFILWYFFYTGSLVFHLNISTLKIIYIGIFLKALTVQFHFKNKTINKRENIKIVTLMKLILLSFIFIFLINISSLFPYILSNTSHISLNINLTIIIYILRVALALNKDIKAFFSHLTPTGTPLFLISFMVIIETISSLIRPITLAVRLMANIVAGHLLITLLSGFSLMRYTNTCYSLLPGLALSTLEISVCLIQAYVLTLLFTLYLKEGLE